MQLRVPRPIWFVVSAVMLVAIAVGLGFGIPAYQQWSAVNELRRYGQLHAVRRSGPEWLRRMVGEDRMVAFDEIEIVKFASDAERFERLNLSGSLLQIRTEAMVSDSALEVIRKIPTLRIGLIFAIVRFTNTSTDQ
jgi:hypothetical protein